MPDAIRLLILSDNKPGHASASEGVLSSIQKLVTVHYDTLHVRLRGKPMRYPLKLLLNSPKVLRAIPQKFQRRLISWFYRTPDRQILQSANTYDWLLSAGGDTSFLNAWLARLHGIRNIYCSSLRELDPALFTVLISSRPGSNGTHEIRVPLAPKPVDHDQITAAGQRFRTEHHLHGETVWAVLIGGDGAGFHFDNKDMESLASGLLALADRHHARLLLTTSRRTGTDLEDVLQAALNKHPAVAYASYYNHHPEKVVAPFLGAADLLFCTADSASMVTEAMTAGKPLYVLSPRKSRPERLHRAFLQKHADAQHLHLLALPELATHAIDQDTFSVIPNHLVDELAHKLEPWIIGGWPQPHT